MRAFFCTAGQHKAPEETEKRFFGRDSFFQSGSIRRSVLMLIDDLSEQPERLFRAAHISGGLDELDLAAVPVGHISAAFPEDEGGGCIIPRLDLLFKIAVEPARRNISHGQRGRTDAAQIQTMHKNILSDIECKIRHVLLCGPGAEFNDTFFRFPVGSGAHFFSVEKSAFAAVSDKRIVVKGIIDDAELDHLIHAERE